MSLVLSITLIAFILINAAVAASAAVNMQDED